MLIGVRNIVLVGTAGCFDFASKNRTRRFGSKPAQDRTTSYGTNLAVGFAESDEASTKVRNEEILRNLIKEEPHHQEANLFQRTLVSSSCPPVFEARAVGTRARPGRVPSHTNLGRSHESGPEFGRKRRVRNGTRKNAWGKKVLEGFGNLRSDSDCGT